MRAPDFWARDNLLARLLAPFGLAYGLAGRLRRRWVRPCRLPVPVVCVGNLVAGGAGKTPVVIALSETLSEAGCAVHCLTRGYGGREAGPLRVDPDRHDAAAVGDEALLLARRAPTWVARDRVAGAAAAVAAGAEVLLLDDGFQNPSLEKDLALLVVDGAYGLGNGRVMPAGPLREAADGGIARADAIVLLGNGPEALLARLAGRPLIRARLVPEAATAAHLVGARVLAFAGIGRPEKFFATLEALGARVIGTRAFPDHHPYGQAELAALAREAAAEEARLVTTEKDAVRLPAAFATRVETLPVHLVWESEALMADLLAATQAGP